jgi:hypothetical protein
VYDVKDWRTGVPLRSELLGKLAGLELHHIFPKNLLYKAGYNRSEVNALSNFTFLTKATNLEVTNRDPAEYIAAYEARHPGVVASHWIPMEPDLWRLERYREFLAARRELLAEAANRFLAELAGGAAPDIAAGPRVIEQHAAAPAVELLDNASRRISESRTWVLEQDLAEGIQDYELVDEASGGVLAIFDLAWPDGMQLGLTEPVALLLDEPPDVGRVATAHGFRFFTSVDALRHYVEREVLEGEARAA